MDVKLKLAFIFADIILPLIVGYLCRYQKRFREPFFNNMMSMNVLCLIPILAGLSCWVIRFNADLFWLPVFGLLLGVIPGVAAYLCSAGKFEDYLERGSYLISAILSNFGTLGGLCAFIILGENGYAYTQLAVLLQNAGLFLFCFPLAQYYYQKSLQGARKPIGYSRLFFNWNQLPVVGLFIGAGLNYSGIARPESLGILFDPLVHFAAWTALMPIGFSLELEEMRQYFRKIAILIPIKFVINPGIAFILTGLLISDRQVIQTILIMSFTPTAINAVITAKLHGLNLNIAMAAFVLTTTIFILLIFPALVYWMS